MRSITRRRGSETFVGEKALMSELQFLMTEKKKSKVYFLQGDGEMSLNSVERGHPSGRKALRGFRRIAATPVVPPEMAGRVVQVVQLE